MSDGTPPPRVAECPADAFGRSGCAEALADHAAGLGVEVVVSTAPPLVVGPHPAHSFRCPHGVEYWIEPTGEQRAQWVRDRVR